MRGASRLAWQIPLPQAKYELFRSSGNLWAVSQGLEKAVGCSWGTDGRLERSHVCSWVWIAARARSAWKAAVSTFQVTLAISATVCPTPCHQQDKRWRISQRWGKCCLSELTVKETDLSEFLRVVEASFHSWVPCSRGTGLLSSCPYAVS